MKTRSLLRPLFLASLPLFLPIAAVEITEVEYFFNDDPGQGNGTSLTVTSSQGRLSQSFSIPASAIAALPDGLHRITLRIRDDQGRWSLGATRVVLKSSDVLELSSPVSQAEYFIDTDPGQGNGTPIPVTGSALSVGFPVSVSPAAVADLSEGFHRLGFRVRDADGDWSLAETRLFHKGRDAVEGVPLVVRIEYRWYQNRSAVSPVFQLTPDAPGNPISFQEMASLAGLAEGQTYQLGFVAYDENGVASIAEKHDVVVETTDSNGDGLPDQWKVNNGFGIHEVMAGLDTDQDGLTNLEEFQAGTNPQVADTSGDGIADGLAFQLAALGFDPLVNNPVLVDALGVFKAEKGLLTEAQLQALALGKPVLSRDPVSGQFTLRIRLVKSTNLKEFEAMPFEATGTKVNETGEIEFTFTSPDDAVFYRLETR